MLIAIILRDEDIALLLQDPSEAKSAAIQAICPRGVNCEDLVVECRVKNRRAWITLRPVAKGVA